MFCGIWFMVVFGSAFGITPTKLEKYDFIIVGAGSSGATLASRLTEDPKATVLLLEAGGPPNDLSEIPLFPTKLLGSELDWNYKTVPQDNCYLDQPERRATWPRGKVLGGSSTINAMIHVRGNRRDYDQWEALGAKGWSYKDVLPYFMKSEDYLNPDIQDIEPSNIYHGKGGPLTVSWSNYSTRISTAFYAAGYSQGLKLVDYNGETQTGFSPIQATIRDGRRCSTEKAFLRPAYNRSNLEILTYAQVTKILFDEDKRAYGVQYEVNKNKYEVNATKEVIMSAGTIGSPQIMLLSGIGPKEHLQKLKIPVVQDLPVGRNLKDHVGTFLNFLVNSSDQTNHTFDYYFEQLQKGQGPLTVPSSAQSVAFVNTKYANASDDYPDVEFLFAGSVGGGIVEPLFGFPVIPGKDLIILLPFILRPKSTGFIELNSTDPYVHPNIDPKVFSGNQDYLTLFEAVKLGLSMTGSSVFKLMGISPIPAPSCQTLEFGSDSYIDCVVRHQTTTVFHPIGTCRMGNPSEDTTVVDPELKVKGIKNLRVVDASIIPEMPSGHLNAVVIMIAEKAADIIKGTYKA